MREEIQQLGVPRDGGPGGPSGRLPVQRDPLPARDADTDADLSDRYRLLVELIPDGVVVHQDGLVVYVNVSAAQMVGSDHEHVLGFPMTDFLHPASIPVVRQRVATTTEPGVPSAPALIQLRRRDGRPVSVESITVLTSWQGRPAHQVILRDLTDRNAAEAALRHQAELVAHVSDAIVATDAARRVTSWNPAAEATFGLAASEVMGREITAVLGAGLDPEAVILLGRGVHSVRRGDGARLWVRATATALPDGEGHVLLCSDETAQHAAEQRFTAVVAALQEGVLLIDEAGLVQAANPAAEQLLDEPAERLLGREAASLPLRDEDGRPLAPEQNPLLVTHRTGVAQHGRVVVVQRGDGTRRWLSATTRPLAGGGLPAPAVVSFTDVTERRAAAERLLHTATHDPLTGLPNRSLLLDHLGRLLVRSKQRSQSLAVLSIDLDNFKVINDSVGHDVGDAALQVAARRVQRQVRDHDLVARLGGDEFVVVAAIAQPEAAGQLADRLLASLGRPMSGKLRGVPLNASIGVVVVPADDERTPNELVRDADAAMYQAKDRGGHRAELFDTELRARVVRRLQLESDLRDAIETPALWVAYQPLVDLATGRWVGAEALARWNHPVFGPINPAEFVSIAEQSELIHTLGHRTLVAACGDAARLRSTAADFQMSVNLSVRQLDDSRLVDEIQEVLARSGLAPSGLCLEVTESSLAVDEQLAGRTLTALRGLGVSVAIDDFGTGYSSLARLRSLPVNELKIDRSFVTTLPTDPQARHVVAGIVALAHALDMRVVAEGVETAEHAGIVADLGCDLAQGYLYARPVAIEDFELGRRRD